ncbi:MAG: cysteine--tRNA ligase [Spirochaetes bacterium]|nr:cysteine--tRNA ligase [Spirochaetota bacterium]
MSIKLYNTLTCRTEELIPGGERMDSPEQYPPVTIYSCGPTVYGPAHIGNFRTYIFNDLLRRYLKFRGYRVNHAMNITDVDDKTIAGSSKEGISLREYTDRYTATFFDDLKTLGIEPVEHNPRATESIDAMIDIIARLNKKGLVYEKEGSLYFSISKYPRYGRLSRVDSREIKSGLRYDTDEYEKDDIRDFALWKGAGPDEVGWDTPFGRGRPGWHIECSAMVRKIFGTTIDIHTGGVDLIFPHHENEIAQSEGAYDEPFVRHWVHWEHLLVDGAKMSKSKGNFYLLRDLTEKGHSPRSVRYLLMSAHYRKQLNFTIEGLRQAESALGRIDNLIVRLKDIRRDGPGNAELPAMIEDLFSRFCESVDDDLNISRGLADFFDFLHGVNGLIDGDAISMADANLVMDVLKRIDTVFGFIFFGEAAPEADVPWIEDMIRRRQEAKKARDFARADSIREELSSKGIILEDTKDGTRWKQKT